MPPEGLRPLGTADQVAPHRPAPPVPQLSRPREPEPVIPAPGQEDFGSLANIRQIMRGDKLFAAVLVLKALEVLLALMGHRWVSLAISGLVFWGIVTFRWWGFWIAVIGAAFGAMGGLLLMLGSMAIMGLAAVASQASAAVLGGAAGALGLLALAINGFVLWVLWTRKDMFD
ncbi:MAG: hypothetical protein ACE149_17240 [Armatimonadota bacterium]